MIVKTLLSSLLKKKMRTALLLFSIAVCSALLFANEGFRQTCEKMIYDADTRWAGRSDLYITPKKSVGASEWIEMDEVEGFVDNFEYTYGFVQGKALFAPDTDEMHYFTILGVDIDAFNNHNPLTLELGEVSNWFGDRIVIGQAYAQKLGVGIGDSVELEVGGILREFQISAISQPSGLFTRDLADGGYLLTPRETLSEILGGECNLLFIKMKNQAEVLPMKDRLTQALPQYSVHMGIDNAVILAETNNYVLPFRFSSIAVIFMSVFIIYSSFNLIVIERIGILGILRSIGCSRRRTNRILLVESAVIGAIGGILGCGLGIFVLYFIKNSYFSGQDTVLNAPVILGIWPFAFTLIASMLITVLSAVLPIFKVTREPIKNIILNDVQKKIYNSARLWWVGFILLLPCLITPQFISNNFNGMIIASFSAVLALVGINLLIPKLCAFFAWLAGKLPLDYEIQLGIKNTGDFPSLVNNIRLFSSTIAIMVFMTTIFYTLGVDLRGLYQRENYDITVVLRETTNKTLHKLSQTEGVKEFYGVYETYAPISSHGSFMNAVIGIDDDNFFDYSPANIPTENREALVTLNSGRNIVTTNILRDKLGLNLGDTLTLQFENGLESFVVTGYVDTNYGIGHVGYISSDNYRAVVGTTNYTKLLVRALGNPDAVKNNIQRSLSRDVLSAQTKQEAEAANADKVEGIFDAINTYAYFAMLIGVIGIINNIVACFLGRRRNLALYRSIGMSSSQVGRMLMTEAVTIGLIGISSGLLTGLLMILCVPFVVGMLWGNVAINVPTVQISILCLAGILVMLLASIIPSVKGKNITIMDTLRYE